MCTEMLFSMEHYQVVFMLSGLALECISADYGVQSTIVRQYIVNNLMLGAFCEKKLCY